MSLEIDVIPAESNVRGLNLKELNTMNERMNYVDRIILTSRLSQKIILMGFVEIFSYMDNFQQCTLFCFVSNVTTFVRYGSSLFNVLIVLYY